jgi:hypothetical protein
MLNSDCWFLISDSWFLRRAAAREFFFGQVCPELPNLSPNLSLNLFLLWSKSGKAD